MFDELAIDAIWFTLRLSGRIHTARLRQGEAREPLAGPVAVLIPAWQEAEVIGATIAHMLAAWPQAGWRLYVGCYHNDPATLAAAMRASGNDPRLRLVIHAAHGPTTKADCLNRLYEALCADEARHGQRFRAVVLQDAEDMVHPQALGLIDRALDEAEFVQLPVRPELPARGRWIAGHYADEFAESHAKTLAVRDALGASLPAAGVGCGFAREVLERIGEARRAAGEAGPFAPDCLTEDYELGLMVGALGGRSRFLRWRDAEGGLIATRSYFPATLPTAVRQKTRWIHGIALQGWDRLGWSGNALDVWMALRDRKGPLAALVLGAAYLLIPTEGLLLLARATGRAAPALPPSPALEAMLRITFLGLAWRALLRFAFTAREYGLAEGARAVLRIPVANVITIMAGRRALGSYFATLRGCAVIWDKTVHREHPAMPWHPGQHAS